MAPCSRFEAQLVMRNYEGFVKRESCVAAVTADRNLARHMSGLQRAVILLALLGRARVPKPSGSPNGYHLPHLSTGDMLRDHIQRNTELGRKAKPLMERGELVPDDIVLSMVEERISQPDCANGFVFDGFPRTLAQPKIWNGFAGCTNLITPLFCIWWWIRTY